jgi:predicted dithiol-disulfide oxidoreductase (DUF899 family)
MTEHTVGTREEWVAARLELLKAEKELMRRSDELVRQRQKLPSVRLEKDYRFETEDGSASRYPLAELTAFTQRMGWTVPCASSLGSDFNFDFGVAYTDEELAWTFRA